MQEAKYRADVAAKSPAYPHLDAANAPVATFAAMPTSVAMLLLSPSTLPESFGATSCYHIKASPHHLEVKSVSTCRPSEASCFSGSHGVKLLTWQHYGLEGICVFNAG